MPDGSFAYASVSDGRATIDLSAAPADARVAVDGMQLRGTVDLESEIRVVPPTLLGRTVMLPPGAHVSVHGTDGDRALVGLGRFSFDEGDEMHWVSRPEAWVPCSTGLGLGFAYRDEDSERRERLALGLPLDPPSRWIPVGTTVAIASTPGGETEATMASAEYPIEVLVLEERSGMTRIARQHWTGATLVGWVHADQLSGTQPEEGGAGGVLGLLGGMMGTQSYQVCHAAIDLPLTVRQIARTDDETGARTELASPMPPVEVGTLAAGSRFVLDERRGDGTAVITPHPQGHVFADGDAEWLVPATDFACVTETWDPMSPFQDAT